MVTININGRYGVTGTNEAQVYCLSTDTKPIGPPMRTGYRLDEIDTGIIYRYDESGRKWWPQN